MKKSIHALILAVFTLLFNYSSSYGWSISTPHSSALPLILHPGDSGTAQLCINAGDSDVLLKIHLDECDGAAIASFVNLPPDGFWLAPAGTCNPIYMSVNVPVTGYQNDYNIIVHAEEVSTGCGSDVCIGKGLRVYIPVQVTPAVLTVGISEPSGVLTKSGPITYDITYGDARYITLSAADVTLNTTGTATGHVSVEGQRVTISNITGDGTIGISIAAGTSHDSAGNYGPAAGPSATFTVLSTPPMTLLRTGQASCYDNAGVMIPCAGTGQDGDWRAGLPWLSPRFTDNGDGTMTDRMTGLIWSKDANVMATRNPDFGGVSGTVTWSRAFEYVDKLNAEGYLGFNDWRLPTKEELSTFVDLNTVDSSVWLRKEGFTVDKDFNYWSSSTAWSSYMAITMQLSNGDMPAMNKEATSQRVWPVRGAAQKPWPTPRFVDNSDGTMTDNLTGLVWLKNADCFGAQSWSDALALANNLASGSCGLTDGSVVGDWRMPSISELRSLDNPDERVYYWLNIQGFSNTQYFYWSSTTYLSSPDCAWYKYYQMYGSTTRYKNDWSYLWPVRSGTVSSRSNLNVSKSGNGSGTVMSNPLGINCGSDCSTVYASDTLVTLTPQPASGSYFAGWTGDCVGKDTCVVTMSQARSVTAIFQKPFLYADFTGAGIWKNDGSAWSQITTGTPQLMATSGTDLYATFPPSGIWQYNGTDWSQSTPNNPDRMVVSGTTLYGTFTGNGIWKFDGTTWSQATPNNPDDMVIAGGSLYGTFGISGIWKFDGSDWSQVTTNTPTQMVGSTNALYGIFAGAGIWKYEGTEWTQVTSNTPEQLISGGTNLYGTFSGSGIWKYDGTDWSNVTSNTPQQMTATSTALYGVFSGTGIWKHDGTSWSQVTANDPLSMVAGE